MKTALIYTDDYTRYDYGPGHPLRMERLKLTYDLMEAYGLTRLPGAQVRPPEKPGEECILKTHSREYMEVLQAASVGVPVPGAYRFGLGPGDNPIFPGMYDAAVLAVGGSLLAARLVASGEVERAFSFAGGLHHAFPDRASGFCYLNDAVIAIQFLLERGLQVCYVDIDAHHGDGVQHAFYRDPRVLTVSTHERGDRLFPGTGFVGELGEGPGHGYSVNLPLQPFTDDEVYLEAFEAVVPPVVKAFRPDVVVAQLGIDSHWTDPLTHLALTVNGFAQALRRILELSPRLVALGGGGYDLGNVARAWTIAWGLMNGIELGQELPAGFRPTAVPFHFRPPALWDPPHQATDQHRRWAREFSVRQVQRIQETIFPLLSV